MATERFIASVSYDDWKGTVAADSMDSNDVNSWLKAKGYKKEDNFLLGISFYAGDDSQVFVDFLFASVEGYDDAKTMLEASEEPVEIKKISEVMQLSEFFGLFKRFSIKLSSHGMLGVRDFRYNE